MLVPCCRRDRDLIKGDPVLEVFLAVIFFELLELEIMRPDDLLEMRGELFQARRTVGGIVLDAAHVFVDASVDALTGVLVREVLP